MPDKDYMVQASDNFFVCDKPHFVNKIQDMSSCRALWFKSKLKGLDLVVFT